MVSIILLSIITSLFIFGWSYANTYVINNTFVPNEDPTQPAKRIQNKPNDFEVLGLLHWNVRVFVNWVSPKYVDYIMKPLFGCPVCMSSVYGTVFYLGYVIKSNQHINSETFIMWGVQVVCTAGLNTIIRNR